MSGYEAENPELQAGPTQAANPAASSDNQRGTQDDALGCGWVLWNECKYAKIPNNANRPLRISAVSP